MKNLNIRTLFIISVMLYLCLIPGLAVGEQVKPAEASKTYADKAKDFLDSTKIVLLVDSVENKAKSKFTKELSKQIKKEYEEVIGLLKKTDGPNALKDFKSLLRYLIGLIDQFNAAVTIYHNYNQTLNKTLFSHRDGLTVYLCEGIPFNDILTINGKGSIENGYFTMDSATQSITYYFCGDEYIVSLNELKEETTHTTVTNNFIDFPTVLIFVFGVLLGAIIILLLYHITRKPKSTKRSCEDANSSEFEKTQREELHDQLNKLIDSGLEAIKEKRNSDIVERFNTVFKEYELDVSNIVDLAHVLKTVKDLLEFDKTTRKEHLKLSSDYKMVVEKRDEVIKDLKTTINAKESIIKGEAGRIAEARKDERLKVEEFYSKYKDNIVEVNGIISNKINEFVKLGELLSSQIQNVVDNGATLEDRKWNEFVGLFTTKILSVHFDRLLLELRSMEKEKMLFKYSYDSSWEKCIENEKLFTEELLGEQQKKFARYICYAVWLLEMGRVNNLNVNKQDIKKIVESAGRFGVDIYLVFTGDVPPQGDKRFEILEGNIGTPIIHVLQYGYKIGEFEIQKTKVLTNE